MLKLDDKFVSSAHYYSQLFDYMREISRSTSYIVNPFLVYFDNIHKTMGEHQRSDLIKLWSALNRFFTEAEFLIQKSEFERLNTLSPLEISIRGDIDFYIKNQIRRLTLSNSGKRNAKLFLDIVSETKTLLLHCINLRRAHRDFAIGAKIFKSKK